jgi:hypothetical protein
MSGMEVLRQGLTAAQAMGWMQPMLAFAIAQQSLEHLRHWWCLAGLGALGDQLGHALALSGAL